MMRRIAQVPFLLGCLFLAAFAETAPCEAQARAKMRIYDIVFEGRGTYAASATGINTAYFDTAEQQISMAWRTVYSSVMWDGSSSTPYEPLATSGIPEFSGDLVETGISGRECQAPGAFSCSGPVSTCEMTGDIYVLKALVPGYQFSIDAFDTLGVCYEGGPCSGCYTAYPAQFGDLSDSSFTAHVTVTPADLKRGKVIYYVSGPTLAPPECATEEHPICSQSFSWTGEVTFTLLSDTYPPYVRPGAKTFKASKKGQVKMKLEAAHPQVGPASGTVTLSGGYGKGSFKIKHGGIAGSAKISLSEKAKQLLKKKRQLKCKATIKAKDMYGTAAEKVKITIRL